jgi:calcineurin-like phosphoesterase family protein
MTIWFTSDEHHGHRNIITYSNRPFNFIEEMSEVLIANHNSVVKTDDIVYHLGDFSLNKTAPGLILPRLNGIHHLIAGNHDHCHPVHAKNPAKLERFRKTYFDAGFKTVELSDQFTFDIKVVKMSHFPYFDENALFDQRYPKLRPIDDGSILLHGHVHNAWKTQLSPKGSLMINVGVDAFNYFPVALKEIELLIRKHIGLSV